MANPPSRVSRMTSPADIPTTMASQSSRRACRSGSTGEICSSMKSMVTMMMSAPRIARRTSSSALSSFHSVAAWRLTLSPGRRFCSLRHARSTAPDRCRSSVTMATLTGVGSAAEMGFGIVQRFKFDGCHTALGGITLGVAACLAADEKGNLAQFVLGFDGPVERDRCAFGRPAAR